MCGVSLLFSFGSDPVSLDRLSRMHDLAAHRGPDGEGWLAIDADWRPTLAPSASAARDAIGGRAIRLAAAFRWLKIQDLDAASAQPMASPCGDIWLLFNGEIYNHGDLRRHLSAAGRRFGTACDTEVFLAAYEQWGAACFERLEGMWGAIVIDLRRRRLVISRDRFGIRPLFYRVERGGLAIGSEAKQIVASTGERPRANRDAVRAFILARRLERDETYFDEVRAVPPASYAEIDLTGALASVEFKNYWRLERAGDVAISRREASERLERHLERSVALQLCASVPVGALMSGGLDSSVVSSLLVEAHRRQRRPSTLISVTTDATGVVDERPYMRAMATALRGPDVVAHEAPLDALWLDNAIDRVTWHQEEPLPGVALVAQFRAYAAAAAAGLKVVLEGTGADELFGGYPRHQLVRIREHLHQQNWYAGAREVAAALRRSQPFRMWATAHTAGFLARRVLRRPVRAPQWLGPAILNVAAQSREPGVHRDLSALAAMSFDDITRGNVPAALSVGDRNAMAHSIETRVPFLDHELVEFAFQLPDDLKTCRGEHKIVLRDVARRRLPATVAERRARVGFGAPIRDWMRGPLRPRLQEISRSPVVRDGELFNPDHTERFISGFLAGKHDDDATVWRIDALVRWMRVCDVVMS